MYASGVGGALGGDRFLRQANVKGRTVVLLRLGPYTAAVSVHNAAREREADPVARYIVAVQAAEDLENLLAKLRFDADAVVLHGENPVGSFVPDPDMNLRRNAGFPVLDGITNQIEKNIFDLIVRHNLR